MTKRKKVCPNCGRKLWSRDFYKDKNGNPVGWCRDCQLKSKRERYERVFKKPDGLRYDPGTGRTTIKNGHSVRIYWTAQMLSDLRRFYPTTTNDELAELLNVSKSTLARKARELKLKKDEAWLHDLWERSRIIANAVSKQLGYPGSFRERPEAGIASRFQKGHTLTPEQKEKQRAGMRRFNILHPEVQRKKTAGLMKPVCCVASGEEWDSIHSAAASIGITAGYLSSRIAQGIPVRGQLYELKNNQLLKTDNRI